MSRFVQRSALAAAGLAGTLLVCAPTRADAPRAPGLACAAWASDRPTVCRPARTAHRRMRTHAMVADGRLPLANPALYGPSRYVSLLILGIGY